MPTVTTSYRTEVVTLAATTRFDTAKFSGSWHSVETIGTARTHFNFDLSNAEPGGLMFVFPDNAMSQLTGYPFTVDLPQAGVLDVTHSADATGRWVVMWVDESYATAALGWADGRAAYILTRPGKVRTDQIAAAREVLAFNGWDVSELEEHE